MERRFLSALSRWVPRGQSSTGTATAPAKSTAEKTSTQAEVSRKLAYLSAMRIFRDLSLDEIKMIEKSTVMKTLHKGKMIYMPGETGEVLFLLKEGFVHLYRLSAEGRKLIIQTVGPMSFFGEMSIIGQRMHTLFAEAAEDCLVCVMSRTDVERLILAKPQVALRMIEEIGLRLYDIRERLGDCTFKGVSARVASLLLTLSHDGASPLAGARHQDLADMLGVYRETVSSTLGHFRDEGIIELNRKEISIVNAERLREIAEEEIIRKR